MRGTPQQIIEKYNQLARDAHLSGDRVAAENFQQHAEHYLRLLGVAQKEQEARREEQERQNRERQADRDRERAKRQEREAAGGDPGDSPQPEIVDVPESEEGSELVQTPESASEEKPKRNRKPHKPKEAPVAQEQPDQQAAVSEPSPVQQSNADSSDAPEAAE